MVQGVVIERKSKSNSCDINLLPKQKTKTAVVAQQAADTEVGYNSRGWFDSQSNNEEDGLLVSEGSNEDFSQQLYEKPPRILNMNLLDQFVPKGQR